jgi:hypothetical protein
MRRALDEIVDDAHEQEWPLDTPAKRLIFARIRAGYGSAVEFSRTQAIPQPTYALHETGGRGIRAEIAKRYAEALKNCTAEWILTAGENPGSPPVIGGSPDE